LSLAPRHEVGRATDDPGNQRRREDLDVGECVSLEGQLASEDRVEWVRVPHPQDVTDFVRAIHQAPVNNVVRFTLGDSAIYDVTHLNTFLSLLQNFAFNLFQGT
jgi:hypothetical protein